MVILFRLPNYRALENPEHRAEIAEFWASTRSSSQKTRHVSNRHLPRD